ncbi:MAG: hypothetical protein U0359_07775 [Byssovorax sp.]
MLSARSKAPALAIAPLLALLFASSSAWADRVALLPARGGMDDKARAALDGEISRSLTALGHTPVQVTPAMLKSAGVLDGVADTAEEYRAVGAAAKVDWVLVGTTEPAVTTARVELSACLMKLGRVESVAREVHQASADPEVKQMVEVLLRPEGIGAGELPWEKAPPPPPPPATPPPPTTVTVEPPKPPPGPPPAEGKVAMDYPLGRQDVWPAYSGGNRPFVGALVGVAGPVARPFVPGANVSVGSGASFVGGFRGGYAITDLGLEIFGDFGGNLFGPKALWLDAGARYMWGPLVKKASDGMRGTPLFFGPSLSFGMFVRLPSEEIAGVSGQSYSAPAEVHPVLGASIDVAYALSRSLQLGAELGNLRWVPSGSGSILLMGMTAGAAYRF